MALMISTILKTVIWRRLTPFCKLAIFWVLIGLSKDFTVRGPKSSPKDKHYMSSLQCGHSNHEHQTVFSTLLNEYPISVRR